MSERSQIQTRDSRIEPVLLESGRDGQVPTTSASERPESVSTTSR